MRRRADRIGDALLLGICIGAALLAAGVLVLIAKEVIGRASRRSPNSASLRHRHDWAPPRLEKFGAASMVFGTPSAPFAALVLRRPGRGRGRALPRPAGADQRPQRDRAAGRDAGGDPERDPRLLGHPVLAPFVHEHVEPFLHGTLGFMPMFGEPQTTGASIFTASLILTIMVIPIIASVSRDLFLAVPSELQDGAAALGATRWEVVRGVVLPSTASGVVAASLLGLGRALGEAIAVTQVIGAGSEINGLAVQNRRHPGRRIAAQFPSAL